MGSLRGRLALGPERRDGALDQGVVQESCLARDPQTTYHAYILTCKCALTYVYTYMIGGDYVSRSPAELS